MSTSRERHSSKLPPINATNPTGRLPKPSLTSSQSQKRSPIESRPGPRRSANYTPRHRPVPTRWPKIATQGQYVVAAGLAVVIGYNFLWEPAFAQLAKEKGEMSEAGKQGPAKEGTSTSLVKRGGEGAQKLAPAGS